jgi:hypothetical protein
MKSKSKSLQPKSINLHPATHEANQTFLPGSRLPRRRLPGAGPTGSRQVGGRL